MIYLSKILPILFLPLGITIILILIGLTIGRRLLIVLALVLLYVCSTPFVGRQALKLIEGDAVRGLPQDAPSVDAIVVLSSGRNVAPGKAKISEWEDANRFFGGIELYAAGKAPLLIFTGGAAPWEPGALSEGEILKLYAHWFGVPLESIKTTEKVFNTAAEAAAVAHLMNVRSPHNVNEAANISRILLVTSAFHMPRAKAQFEAQGFHVSEYPVGFIVSTESQISILDLCPSAVALSQTELALREFYGRGFYSLRHRVSGD